MTCPKCGAEISAEKNFCEQCGFDLREIKQQENLLETDPILTKMDNKYIKHGRWRLVSGLAVVLSLFLVYNSLEDNISGRFGEFGMVLFLPALVVFIISCVMRGVQKKKVMVELQQRRVNNITIGKE